MADERTKPGPRIADLGLAAVGRVLASLRGPENGREPGESDESPRLSGYILARRLGQGAGGVVYHGYREGSDRPLAIKVLNRRLVEHDTESKRAWRELELLMQLRLPAVPRVIDYGVQGGRLFIATEFVDGLPLDRYCQEGGRAAVRSTALPGGGGSAEHRADARCDGLDRRARVELLAKVADAVQSLHEQGVIHRDIKPSNVLVDASGQPMIIDLGIATLLARDVMETLTADGAPIGSPAFMAPEQARGERDRISTRTDVYGLGATAFLILTGKTPHDMGTTIHEAVRRVAQDPARRARELEPGLPKPLAAVMDKAAAAKPEDRYASAEALATDLRHWLRGEPVMAGDAGMWTRVSRWIGRHPILATSSVCGLVAVATLCLVLVATWWIARRPDHFIPGRNVGGEVCAVTLATAANRPLVQFGGDDSSVPIARIVDRPAELGGGRVAVLCVSGSTAVRTTGGQLWVCDLNDITHPLFTTVDRLDVPEYPEPYKAEGEQQKPELRFVVHAALLADVFPENPGPEIIVVHESGQTPTCLRIYDLGLNILFECWHFGSPGALAWSKEIGVVCTADRHGSRTHTWNKLGYPGDHQWPHVILAVRPGFRDRLGWVVGADDKAINAVPWYKCLWPLDLADQYTLRVHTSDGPTCPEGVYVAVVNAAVSPQAAVQWRIDANGNPVSASLDPGDGFKRLYGNEESLWRPAAERFTLVDFPPPAK